MANDQTVELHRGEGIDVTVTASTEAMSTAIGRSLIMNGDGGQFAYLAGIAFDGMSGYGSIVEILVEYLEAEDSFDLTDEELDEITSTLRDAHVDD